MCLCFHSLIKMPVTEVRHDLVASLASALMRGTPHPGNAQGIKLPPCTLVKIFRGIISSWNHSEIVEANPDLALPDR